MIESTDVDFHQPENPDYTHCETNWFTFSVPEQRLLCVIYVLVRKPLGCMSVDVQVCGAMTETRSEALYIDSQHQLPAVGRLSDYTTENGLSVKAHSPRDYTLSYSGYDDFELNIDFEGLMEPFDIHDPKQNPRAADQHAKGGGMGAAFGGHFECTGHLTGTMQLRGESYTIDCVETMDHSWGPRPEYFMSTVGWSHAHFGRDMAIKWLNTWDLDAPVPEQQKLHFGYVMHDGKTYGLTDATFETHRVGSLITAMEVHATDVRGERWHMHGTAEVGMPMIVSSAAILSGSNMRWTLHDGRVGYGLATDFRSVQDLSRRYGRRWTELPRRVSS